MSEINSILSSVSRPTMLALHGEPVTYTPSGGAGQEVTGLVGGIESETDRDERGRSRRRRRSLTLSLDEVATPSHHATVTIDGEDWEVATVDFPGGGVAELQLVQQPLVERSRDQYRMRMP